MSSPRLKSTFTIRAVRRGDAEEVAALSGQLGYPTEGSALHRRFRELLGRPDHGILVAVDEAGCLLGWVHIFLRSLIVYDRHAELGGLVVAEGARGQGIGAALLEAAEAWTIARGIERIFIRSNQIRDRAHQFYRRSGYELVKQSLVFLKDLG